MTFLRKRFFAMVLPFVFLVPAYPAISLWAFEWTEPTYIVPLALQSPLRIRKDPYGSGVFGARRNGGRRHLGIDLSAPRGTEVIAARSGRVFIGRIHNGMGRYVEIRHPDGWTTRYGHLGKIFIRDRQRVRRGTPLGTVGKSGNAGRRLIQPHLHFELLNARRVPVNPWPYLARKRKS